MPVIVPPEINQPRPGRVLLVGRDPGEHEVEEGRPFVGRAGQLLDEILSEAGLRRSEINITNVVPIRPAENEFRAHDPYHVAQGIEDLHKLIKQLQPSLIVTLGNEAAYSLIDEWPSSGRGVYGAKDITERRGYFWETPHGQVLTTLHPAGVARKAVPGRFLIGKDFLRARKWLDGQLPREVPPAVKRLNSYMIVSSLVSSRLLAWDIETKWDMTSLLWCGFCGDDLQPYAAGYPWEFKQFAVPVLTARVPKVGHNGKFDLSTTQMLEQIEVQGYNDDTQQMWWALEPELAGDDDTDADDVGIKGGASRMTRKGLAFLMSLEHNLAWWKNYPKPDDPQHHEKMLVLNGKDTWSTRTMANELMARMQKEEVIAQYRQAMDAYPALLDMHQEGLPINETLRLERINTLEKRKDVGGEITKQVALEYVTTHEIAAFRKMKKCTCCGGGKTQREHCWTCADAYSSRYPKLTAKAAKEIGYKNMKDCKLSLLPCRTCGGVGKIAHYFFNPYSPPQMKKLLYDIIGLPRHSFKGKDMMDEDALKKILRWAKT